MPRPESLNSKRGHGGICLFYKSNLKIGISLLETDPNGLIWIKLCKNFFGLTDDLYVCFIHISPSNPVYYVSHDTGFYAVLEEHVSKHMKYGKVSVIGDLNAMCGERLDYILTPNQFSCFVPLAESCPHDLNLQDLPVRCTMDKTVNSSGLKLLQLWQSSSLMIVHGRIGDNADTGNFTFMSSNGSSLID